MIATVLYTSEGYIPAILDESRVLVACDWSTIYPAEDLAMTAAIKAAQEY